jgi:hypothetical protein
LRHGIDALALTGRDQTLEVQRRHFAPELGVQALLKRFEPALELWFPRTGRGEKGHGKNLEKRKSPNINRDSLTQNRNLTK